MHKPNTPQTALQLLHRLGQLRLALVDIREDIHEHPHYGICYAIPLYNAIRELETTAGAIALDHLSTTPETTP